MLSHPKHILLTLAICSFPFQALLPADLHTRPSTTNQASQPPKEIPAELLSAYTLDGTIPVIQWYLNDSYSSRNPIFWSRQTIDKYIQYAKEKRALYYGATDSFLFAALEKYGSAIRGKQVAIVGSQTPWYEGIVLTYGGHPTTIEYNKLVTDDPRLTVLTVEEFDKNPQTFDAVISISSIEHDGLGRYGDPINPIGDLCAMEKIGAMLKPDGLLFLAVPIGQDCLVWNAHRIYGPIRLGMLLSNWKHNDSFGFSSVDFKRDIGDCEHQPVFVLQKQI